jgi:hypothetical protein
LLRYTRPAIATPSEPLPTDEMRKAEEWADKVIASPLMHKRTWDWNLDVTLILAKALKAALALPTPSSYQAPVTTGPSAEEAARECVKAEYGEEEPQPGNWQAELVKRFTPIIQRAIDSAAPKAGDVERRRAALEEVMEFFGAAYAEGLYEQLMNAENKEPGSSADLVQRRLLWAYEQSIPAALAPGADKGGA